MSANPASTTVSIRDARDGDLEALIGLMGQLNDEPSPLTDRHRAAFKDVIADRRQRLLVLERAGVIVATAAVIIVPNIGREGRPFAIVENVVVDAPARGEGMGGVLMRYIIDEARRAGCYRISLTSRKFRSDAHRFYERLGFVATSEGFRLALELA